MACRLRVASRDAWSAASRRGTRDVHAGAMLASDVRGSNFNACALRDTDIADCRRQSIDVTFVASCALLVVCAVTDSRPCLPPSSGTVGRAMVLGVCEGSLHCVGDRSDTRAARYVPPVPCGIVRRVAISAVALLRWQVHLERKFAGACSTISVHSMTAKRCATYSRVAFGERVLDVAPNSLQ